MADESPNNTGLIVLQQVGEHLTQISELIATSPALSHERADADPQHFAEDAYNVIDCMIYTSTAAARAMGMSPIIIAALFGDALKDVQARMAARRVPQTEADEIAQLNRMMGAGNGTIN